MSFPEMAVLLVVGLLVLGPRDLPRVASQLGRWAAHARRTAWELRRQVEREIALADVERRRATGVATKTNPAPPPASSAPAAPPGSDARAGNAGESAGA